MTSNLSIGASSANTAERKVSTESKSIQNATTHEQIAATVNTTEELRRAELRGDEYNISEEQLVKAIEQAVKKIEGRSTSLSFSIHDETKRILVKVLDKETGEVIREVPPEKNLDFLASLWQMAGILIDEKR